MTGRPTQSRALPTRPASSAPPCPATAARRVSPDTAVAPLRAVHVTAARPVLLPIKAALKEFLIAAGVVTCKVAAL